MKYSHAFTFPEILLTLFALSFGCLAVLQFQTRLFDNLSNVQLFTKAALQLQSWSELRFVQPLQLPAAITKWNQQFPSALPNSHAALSQGASSEIQLQWKTQKRFTQTLMF